MKTAHRNGWITAQHLGTYRDASSWYNLRRLCSWLSSFDSWMLVNFHAIFAPKQVLFCTRSHFAERNERVMRFSFRPSSQGLSLMSRVILLRKSCVPAMGSKSNPSSSGRSDTVAMLLNSAKTTTQHDDDSVWYTNSRLATWRLQKWKANCLQGWNSVNFQNAFELIIQNDRIVDTMKSTYKYIVHIEVTKTKKHTHSTFTSLLQIYCTIFLSKFDRIFPFGLQLPKTKVNHTKTRHTHACAHGLP